MSAPNVVVVGSGSLAKSICYSAAAVVAAPATVTVVARSDEKATEICYMANARAARSAGIPVRFRPLPADLGSPQAIAEILAETRPRVLLGCASYQSPWEGLHAPSAWTALLQGAGFGVTLPLQAALAIELARAVERVSPETLFLNASFPDAVNPILRALDLPVLSGIGNVATIAATLQDALGLPDQRRLQVLAHHWHLHTPDDPSEEARAWLDGEPLADVTRLLAAQRATPRCELNAVTGHAAALFLRDLLMGAETRTSLPGPQGLPGGYPVRVVGGRVELDLPEGVTRDEAIAWNQRFALRDGVVVSPEGDVWFSPAAERELRRHLPDLAGRFHASETQEVCARLLELRTRLRAA
jgi:hypothetical protein